MSDFFDKPAIKAMTDAAYSEQEFTAKSAAIRQIKKEFLDSDQGRTWLEFAVEKDPALQGKPDDEVQKEVLAYPGLTALAAYLVAHKIYDQGRFADARHLSEAAHTLSGMDIHPGASIHPKVFFDHCTGMVIGETASVGEGAMFFHGVTLGGVGGQSKDLVDSVTGERKQARHPQIGKNVTISLNAQVLGPSEVQDGASVGAQAQILNSHVSMGAVVGPGVMLNRTNVAKDTVVYAAGQNVGVLPAAKAGEDKAKNKDLLANFRAPKQFLGNKMQELYNQVMNMGAQPMRG